MTEVNDLTDEQFEEIVYDVICQTPIPSKDVELTRNPNQELFEVQSITNKRDDKIDEIIQISAPSGENQWYEKLKNGNSDTDVVAEEVDHDFDIPDEKSELPEGFWDKATLVKPSGKTTIMGKSRRLTAEDIAAFTQNPEPKPVQDKPKPVEFIDRETYEDLRRDWENIWGPGKKAKVYQEYRRIEKRCKFFVKHGLPYLAGKHVVEIGANAGLQGYHIDKVAASYVGIEPGNKISISTNPKTDYFLQAKKTEERMSENGTFQNWTIKEFLANRNNFKYNAFFASYALYHFTDPELNYLKEYVFPQCDVVVIQTRHQRRPTKHNKWKFWKPESVERFFRRQGFSCHTLNEVEAGEFHHKRPKPHNGFSLQICVRPEYQC